MEFLPAEVGVMFKSEVSHLGRSGSEDDITVVNNLSARGKWWSQVTESITEYQSLC
jgi:hypothetical protein